MSTALTNKRDELVRVLIPIVEEFDRSEDSRKLIAFLTQHSNLPGRRGNLELASTFVSIMKNQSNIPKYFKLCKSFLEFTAEMAPTNDPYEFIPFCGIWAIGCLGGNDKFYDQAKNLIYQTAHDPRWRMREAVANAIHCLIKQKDEFLDLITTWVEKNDWLLFRAIAAGVAEPSVLQTTDINMKALQIHNLIFKQILKIDDKNALKSEYFKVLQKGLSYTLSVVVQQISKEGFPFIKQLISIQSPHQEIIHRIIKENLKKKRLANNFPERVQEALALL